MARIPKLLPVALVATLTLCAEPPSRAYAQTSAVAQASAPAQLDAAARKEVVDNLEALLVRHYVDADTGKLIAANIAKRFAAGAYERMTNPYEFAEAVTTDLRAINGDKHLMMLYDPRQPAMRVGPEGLRMLGGSGGPGRREPSPAMIAQARRSHFGLARVDILPGNIGYVEIRGFSGSPEAQDAVVAALQYVQYADALIFDLRRNGGGSAELVNFIISHFTGPDTLASLTVKNRSGGETFTRYTLAKVPGPRRTDVPLYVLTSGYTASAGEDFSFVLKNLGRATIVGEPTAGAGHNNAFLDTGHGFGTSISFTRVMDPKSGAEWERIGVQPTVRVDQGKALETAEVLALKQIAAKETDAEDREYSDRLRESIEAQLTPVNVPAATLASCAGEYEGGRRVWVENGQLLLSLRPGAPADTLVPLGDGRFALGAMRILFEGTGSAAKMRITRVGAGTLSYAKVK
ncbi:MAG: S41 family peptidase [Gemmatimonadaceae bacterium]|nr:S41 family peptidase [Gemmatimonadaceae bacterium]NUQ93695.1 S41 family peptidase [Gemmatimonadaceae bacterium]NUR18317.1 S41 family peptidase [Gemmatimonadaceae bacterium]NUS98149.1 S41 family peptidase [Gemmatimonadaceae bacterium]